MRLTEEHRVGQRYPLYALLSKLSRISPEEVALAYSGVVLAQPKRHLLSYNGDPDAVDYFKKRFQEETRVGIYLLASHLNVGLRPFAPLGADYQAQIDQTLEAIRRGDPTSADRHRGSVLRFQGGTIEKVIADQFLSGSPDLGRIYESLRSGAEEFRVYQERFGRDHRSLEYNYIFKALKRE